MFLLCSSATHMHNDAFSHNDRHKFTHIHTTPPRKINTHSLTHSLSPSLFLSPFSGSFASVLRPQGRLTFHSGSVSIPCDHSHAASPPLKVTLVVCQNPNKKTPCNALCVCVCVTNTQTETEAKFVCLTCGFLKQELSVKSNQFSPDLTRKQYVCER